MLTSTRIKDIKSLQLAKFRKELGQFVMEGDKMVREVLNQQRIRRVNVYATEHWKQAVNTDYSGAVLAEIEVVSERHLMQISGMQSPPAALAILEIPKTAKIELAHRALYLDDIQDPGNVGTILRLADWFGITQVFASEATADFFSPKVVQASMGAVLRLHLEKAPLAQIAEQKTCIVAADMHGHSLYDWQMPVRTVLLLGNEGKGIGVRQEPFIQERVTIPRPMGSGAESLNVATATAIILAEWHKQSLKTTSE